jgi:hypothetical protein
MISPRTFACSNLLGMMRLQSLKVIGFSDWMQAKNIIESRDAPNRPHPHNRLQ